MKKFLLILGIIAFNLCAFAIESDFKNSLLKVDYVRTGADSYTIRLFTQKPYSEPIKVIKKTNTNYYILLPETFHSIGSVAPTGDIKSTEVKLFPYAGQDLNNGYTKISIFTSKPLNISAQLNSSTGAVAPSIDPKKLSQLDSAFNTKQAQTNEAQRQAQYAAQQKQLAAQRAQQEAQARVKAQQEAQRQAQIKAQQEAQARAKAQREAQARATVQKEAQLRAQQEAQKQAQIKAQQEAQARAKAQREAQARAQQEAQRQAQQATQKQIQPAAQTKNTNNLQLPDNIENKYEQGTNEKKFDTESLNKAPSEDLSNEEQNIVTQEIPNTKEIEKTLTQIPENPEKLGKKAYIKKVLKNKLRPFAVHLKPYYYIIKDNFILFSALLIAFVGILILAAIGKSKKRGAAQNMEKEETQIESTPEETTQTPLEQTEDAKDDVNNDEIQSFKDEFKDLAYDTQVEQQEPEEEYEEPQVLSSTEIAPNRGFMVIEQQGTKALFGYIFDDVFLLYQFKDFISDYQIKFRISEKQDSKTFFIVKVDKYKLLVKVTDSSMKLELEM